MRHLRISPILWGVLVAITTALVPAARSSAGEDVDGFLQALYEHNYFDTALEYIEMIKTSPLVDADTKSAIPFLHAKTEQYQARAIPDSKLQEKEAKFLKAIASFQAFAKAQPNHPRAVESLLAVGGIYRGMAKTRLDAGGSGDGVVTARKYLKQSETTLTAVLAKLKANLQALLTNPPKVDDISVVREKILAHIVGAEFQLAEVAQDMANTHKVGSPAYKEQLGIAAERFEVFFDEHGDLVIGMQAIVRAGQCYRDMGNIAFALSCFESILDDPDLAKLEVLRPLRNQTMGDSMILWSKQIKDAKTYSQALPIFERAFRISELRGSKDKLRKDPSSLSVLYQRAKLAESMAARMERIRLKAIQKRYKELIEYAAETFKMIAETDSKLQGEAAAAYKELATAYKKVTGKDPEPPKIAEAAVETFADALKQSRRTYQKWTSTLAAIAEAEGAKKVELNQKSVEQLEQIDGLLRMTLEKSDAKTKLSDLADIYSRLAIVYWYQQRYAEAAVIGEHLARRYPEAISARTSADIAIKSWNKMHDAAKAAGEDTAYEKSQIESLGTYISERWPDSDQAADALYRLIAFALEKDDLDAALELLAKMPQNTPHYASSQLILGRRLWRQHQKLRFELQKKNAEFQKNKAKLDETTISETETQLAAMKAKLPTLVAQVEPMLTEGLASSGGMGSPNPRLTYDALFLAELFVQTNRPKMAVDWLENDAIGPLTLLDQEAAIIVQQTGMPASIYRTGLLGYTKLLASLDEERFKSAKARIEDLMAKLEAKLKESRQEAVATSTYYRLGKVIEADIEQQLEQGNEAAASRLTEAFKLMLIKVSGDKNASYPMLYWVAKSLKSLGTTSQELADNVKLDTAARNNHREQAKQSFAEAAKAYEALLSRRTRFKISDNNVIAITIALAECQLGTEDFEKAIASISEALKKQPNYISAQRTAARALQKAGKYSEAIIGQGAIARRGNRRLIWGWRNLAKKIEGDPNYEDIYYEANLAVINCLIQAGKAGSARSIKAAKKTHRNFGIQHSDWGGAKWKPKFDAVAAELARL